MNQLLYTICIENEPEGLKDVGGKVITLGFLYFFVNTLKRAYSKDVLGGLLYNATNKGIAAFINSV